MIKDSGNRTTFKSGAFRDIQDGKGRCDLMPLDVVSAITHRSELDCIENFKKTGNVDCLLQCIRIFSIQEKISVPNLMLEVAVHFQEGAEKYGENNWQKGIPVHSYIDSAVRHFLKHIADWTDERHDRAFIWNIMCCIWTMINKPELDDYTIKNKE